MKGLPPPIALIPSVIVTPTRRLAQSLTKNALEECRKQGALPGPTPQIITLEDFLDNLWDALRYAKWDEALPLRLTAWQELLLWEQIVAKFEKPLLRPSETAHTAKKAWRLLGDWNISIDSLLPLANEDVLVFCQWAQEFSLLCHEKEMISKSNQTQYLFFQISTLAPLINEKFVFYGFDEVVPSVRKLLEALQENGITIYEEKGIEEKQLLAKARAESYINKEQEYFSAASWAKKRLYDYPEETIAVIVPDLAQEWALVDRIFTNVFSPETLLSAHHQTDKPYNISSGHALAGLSIIATALNIITSIIFPQEIQKWGGILRSMYLPGAVEEQGVRARFDRTLQEAEKQKWLLKEIISAAQAFVLNESNVMPILLEHLENLEESTRQKKKLYPSEWATVFSIWLKTLGWPGDRELDSTEYQAMQRWFDLLEEMSKLDSVIQSAWSASEAISHLQRQGLNTLFQAESKEKKIQILGILEAAGLPFETIWITGLNDKTWPSAPSPNPFLPVSLQRENNMPHASAERELAFAREIFQRFLRSSVNMVCSFPERQEDTKLLPSTLIKDFPLKNNTDTHQTDFWTSLYQNADKKNQNIEWYIQEKAPPLEVATENKGGIRILELQAKCPFQAFAAIRCTIQEWPDNSLGLSPADRGIIIHACLENIWKKIKNWEILHEISEETLTVYIEEAVLKSLGRVKEKLISDRHIQLETSRIKKILYEWLLLEKERAPFIVEACEEKIEVSLSGITFKVRVDRRDRLLSGGTLIIDYKTGNVEIKSWLGERPEAPQMPLYALQDRECVGIAFAKIQTNALAWVGLTAQEDVLPKVKSVASLAEKENVSNWNELTNKWQKTLENLAGEYAQGYALADPKEPINTCSYCDFKSFCRIVELRSQNQEDAQCMHKKIG